MNEKIRLMVGLDYELFFGNQSGSVQNCLVEPSMAISHVAERHGVKLTFFVDAGMLVRMKQLAPQNKRVDVSYRDTCKNLEELVRRGHELQLHIHPHWEDTLLVQGDWHFEHQRYRLHEFSEDDRYRIVSEYSAAIAGISGVRPNAYRAGGFCVQPFEKISNALYSNGIRIDSSVVPRSRLNDDIRHHDFRSCPHLEYWHFESDPLVPETNARFTEIPVSTTTVNFSFYWKYLIARKFAGGRHAAFGDGSSISAGMANYLKKLTCVSEVMELSVDGFKASRLGDVGKSGSSRLLNVIGHPKALSRYSIGRFEGFLQENRFDSLGFSEFSDIYPDE